jgi:hypothetical protein
VITKDGKAHHVPDDIDNLVERVWAEHERSPFDKREEDDLDKPPRNWKSQLKKYCDSIMPSALP